MKEWERGREEMGKEGKGGGERRIKGGRKREKKSTRK